MSHQVYCRSDIILRSGRRESPQKLMSIAPSYPSYLEGWKDVVWKLWIRNDIESSIFTNKMGLVRIWEICLRLHRVIQYADDLKVTIIILVAKVLSCGVFLQGSPVERGANLCQTTPPTTAGQCQKRGIHKVIHSITSRQPIFVLWVPLQLYGKCTPEM